MSSGARSRSASARSLARAKSCWPSRIQTAILRAAGSSGARRSALVDRRLRARIVVGVGGLARELGERRGECRVGARLGAAARDPLLRAPRRGGAPGDSAAVAAIATAAPTSAAIAPNRATTVRITERSRRSGTSRPDRCGAGRAPTASPRGRGTRFGTARRSRSRRRRATLFGKRLNSGISTPPTATRSVMSTTSSNRRRPFGKPPRSPAIAPSRLADLERRRRYARVQAHQVGDRSRLRSRRLRSAAGTARAAAGRCGRRRGRRARPAPARCRAPRSPARSSCPGRSPRTARRSSAVDC